MAQQLFTIQDDKIVINKLALKYLEGSIIHAGSLDIVGNTSIQSNLSVKGTIVADTINVKNLITETGDTANIGNWITSKEEDLEGKGLSWTWGNGQVQLFYRNGNRLWASGHIDIPAEKSYKIDNVEVISLTELGPQVTKSKLKEVGTLKSLTVAGNTLLSDFAFFNSSNSRFGLNTDQPNGTFSLLENDVEFIIGSPNYGSASLGTYSNHNLSIITDNTPRVTFKNSGEIVFGSELVKSADVTIYGTLKVDTLISDTRIDRYSPLEFKSSRDKSIYGQGLLWTGTGSTKQLIMRADPDRLWTTESIDIAADHAYFINGSPVLSEHSLGQYVTKSNLKTLGVLEGLEVEGDSLINGNIIGISAKFGSLVISDYHNSISFAKSNINASTSISINVSEDEVYFANDQEISIGNKLNILRPVKIYGPVAIGVSTPDPSLKFSVNGPISINNRKFIDGDSIPTEGMFTKGDICWNSTPTPGNYVGWICIADGSPGTWATFGVIGT